MKVGVLSYPMVSQARGGLEIQMMETIAALNDLGVDAHLIDTRTEKLNQFDLVHIFGAGSGNFRVVQFAKLMGVPAVMTPLIRPHWTRSLARRASLADRFVGRLTSWHVKTEYGELRYGLEHAALLFALGPAEKRTISEAFGIAGDKIEITPNGIAAHFFDASPEAFRRTYSLAPGFILNVASIDPHKNQLGMAQALAGKNLQMVFIGEVHGDHHAYLKRVLAIPGTRHIGALPYGDPVFASAYAAADVLCLASHSEVMPLVVLESLAAGTPVVMTRNHGMDTSRMRGCVIEVDPYSEEDIRNAVDRLLRERPGRKICQEAVRELTWTAVARRLIACYERVLRAPGRAASKHSSSAGPLMVQKTT